MSRVLPCVTENGGVDVSTSHVDVYIFIGAELLREADGPLWFAERARVSHRLALFSVYGLLRDS